MAYDFNAALEDMLKHRPGWIGNFTTTSAPGAMPPGTRCVKVAEDGPKDAHRLGDHCTVLGSIFHPKKGVCYFVQWDGEPMIAVAVVDWKIKEAK